MDIADANTEPVYRYLRAYEDLSRTMRVLVAGVGELEELLEASPSFKLRSFGQRWKAAKLDKSDQPQRAIAFVGRMGVVSAITDLEDFCVGVDAECDRSQQANARQKQGSEDRDEDGTKIKRLYKRLGCQTPALEAKYPVYEYFCKARNCIVHRSGRASKALAACAEEPLLRIRFDSGELPALPNAADGEDLDLGPGHAILASAVCREIAIDVNRWLVNFLGIKGIAYMAAYHSFLSDSPVSVFGPTSAEAHLTHILGTRYRVKGKQYGKEAVRILREMGEWEKCLERFTVQPLNPSCFTTPD